MALKEIWGYVELPRKVRRSLDEKKCIKSRVELLGQKKSGVKALESCTGQLHVFVYLECQGDGDVPGIFVEFSEIQTHRP